MMKIQSLIILAVIALLPFVGNAQIKQRKIMVVFAEDNHIEIPYKFMRSDADEKYDSLPMRFITLKYLFYTGLSERLAQNAFVPIGGVSDNISTNRKYKKTSWFSLDSNTRAINKAKGYVATEITPIDKGLYELYINADSAEYLLLINKIEIHGDILRRTFFMYNYFMDVHFEIYDRNMNLIEGRYLRKKLRLSKDMYWSSFAKLYSAMPDELAFFFLNLKK